MFPELHLFTGSLFENKQSLTQFPTALKCSRGMNLCSMCYAEYVLCNDYSSVAENKSFIKSCICF